MTASHPVLLVGQNADRAEKVRAEFMRLGRGDCRWVSGVEPAFDAIGRDVPSAVVVLLDAAGRHDMRILSDLVATCSGQSKPCPVVVVGEVYREDEALFFFRMGVSDYLSETDHSDRVAGIISALAFGNTAAAAPKPRAARADTRRDRPSRPVNTPYGMTRKAFPTA